MKVKINTLNAGTSKNKDKMKKTKTILKKKSKSKKKKKHSNLNKNGFVSMEHPKTKIDKLIQDVQNDTTREKIVLLFMEVAQRVEICFDFEISWWIDEYMKFRQEPNFTEAAFLIVHAAQIYGRKVDYLRQMISKSVSSKNNEETNDGTKTIENKRKSIKRPLSLHDRLYEAEMITKKFKTIPLVKTTEILSDLNNMNAPKNYFKKWKEYKDWRKLNLKKANVNLPYSIACDENYMHPAMWKYSCIEDFDYDDDIETKKSFKMFTNYMEHRYSALVPDINFIMHFKVKDFIEAEEDEIEIMKILGLPTPPIRTWPPLCKMSNDIIFETSSCSSEDYITKYVALENIILEQENDGNSMNDSINRKSAPGSTDITQNTEGNCSTSENILSEIEWNNTDITSSSQLENNNSSLNGTNQNDTDIEKNDSSNSDRTTVLTNSTLETVNNLNISNQSENIISNISDVANKKTTEKQADETASPGNITDEGIAFGELDEFDRAMLSPVVELFDILKPMTKTVKNSNNFSITLDTSLKNIFGIDESYLNFQQNFALPIDVFHKEHPIERNILLLPERILRKKVLFNLPSEYNNQKFEKRKSKRQISSKEPKIRLFKLNDVNINTRLLTSSPIPTDQDDFLGFTEDEIRFDTFSSNQILSSTLLNSQLNETDLNMSRQLRTFSQDSGIGLSQENSATTVGQSELTQCSEINTLLGKTVNAKKTGEHESQNIERLSQKIQQKDITTDNMTEKSNLANEEINDMNQMMERVQNWHRHLKPLLAKSQDRHHFDVFAIGTDIMNTFPKDDPIPKDPINLEQVMEQKDPSFLSRYFLSMLQLANSNNIELTVDNEVEKTKPTPLNNIYLKLLNNERHTIAVEDDIGMHHVSQRKRRYSAVSTHEDNHIIETLQNNIISLDQQNDTQIVIQKHNEENRSILEKYKETNREILSKEVNANRDDYIRKLSQKHDINLYSYFSKEEIDRVTLNEQELNNIQRDCLIATIQNSKKSKTNDDEESGFFSQASVESNITM